MRLILKKQPSEGNKYLVSFIGPLDGDSSELYSRLLKEKNQEFHLDFSQISFVNSTGIRDWLKFIPLLCEKGSVFFTNCSDIFIFNLNIFPLMRGTAKIVSTRRSFTCTSCATQNTQEFNFSTNATLIGSEPPRCGSCSGKSSWDMPAEDYFDFRR